MDTAKVEELLERLIDQQTEMTENIDERVQEVRDITSELTATNAEIITSFSQLEQKPSVHKRQDLACMDSL